MDEGICQFCLKKLPLVDSHIIPKGLLWGLTDQNGNQARILSPEKYNEFPKKSSRGIYDNFLCNEHEKQFNDWDTYACSLLRDSDSEDVENGWLLKNVDYTAIKLFFLSMLWRAHCAKNPFFDRVALSQHECRLRELIKDSNPGNPNEFQIFLWRSEELLAKGVIAPYLDRDPFDSDSESLFIRFYIPEYMALIKVDNRPISDNIPPNILNESGNWFVCKKQYEGSDEESVMNKVFKYNKEHKNLRTRRCK